MEVEDGTFFMVRLPTKQTLHQTEDEAIQFLKENANGLDPEEANVNVVRITVDDDDWKIAEMSWQNIAIRLMGE
jgi:hypothetical protein